jgi:predicted O-methyltransferase YrrM
LLSVLKRAVKNSLRYEPLPETAAIRERIDAARDDGQPFCPSPEGDLIYSLIAKNDFKSCLEIGFFTGSTALYIAAAVAPQNGQVASICR